MIKSLLQTDLPFYYFPNSGNLGDLLIAEATRCYFRALRLKWNEYDPDYPPPASEKITLVYGGGGRFTPHWPGLENIIKHLTAPNVTRCIILPHSYTEVDFFVQAMDERHTLICREKISYEYLHSLHTKASILLADDMALLMDCNNFSTTCETLSTPCTIAEENLQRKLLKNGWNKRVINGVKKSTIFHNNKRIAFILRSDAEKSSNLDNTLCYDISLAWCASCRATKYNATFIRTFADALRYPDIIVTDRLHVGIMGYLLRKKVYLLDNDYGKLAGVYQQSLKKNPLVHFEKDGKLSPELQEAWLHFQTRGLKAQQEAEYQLLYRIKKLQKKHRKATFLAFILPNKIGAYYKKKKNQIEAEINFNLSALKKQHN